MSYVATEATICPVCGTSFMKKHNRQNYCCARCAGIASAELERQRRQTYKKLFRDEHRKNNLNEVAKLATEAGMSYGYYVARMGL